MKPVTPFAVPKSLEPMLARVLEHWETLKRGQADIPFWDDMKICSLPALANRLILIDAFANPERFRIDYLGDDLLGDGQGVAPGKFIDDIATPAPFEFLRAQCSATVEEAAPTWFRTGTYARLLLPLWGDGRISMLLGGVERTDS